MYKLIMTATFLFFHTLVLANNIKIISEPSGADIIIKDTESSTQFKVGVTPFEMSFDQMTGRISGGPYYVLEVIKEGHHPYRIVVSDLGKTALSLKLNLEVREEFTKYKEIDAAITELFEGQRMIRAGELDKSIALLTKLEEKEPNLSIIPEFLGSAYYLKKQHTTALDYFKKAFKVNPKNRDSFNMKAYLETALGEKKK